MSMSTGDVRRPSLGKLTKAVADDKPEAEIIDSEVDATAEGEDIDEDGLDDDAEATASPARKAAPAAKSKAAPAAKSTPPRKAAASSAKTAPASARAAAKTSPASARAAAKAAPASAKARPVGRPSSRPPVKAGKGGGGKGRKNVPVKVSQGPNWGPIAMFGGAGLVAVLIIAFAAVALIREANQPSWQDRAAGIEGISNYLKSNPDWFVVPEGGNHKAGVLTYPTTPPVGGIHNPRWQNCMGDVYTSEIAKEQATHSLEHGAVWVAYRPDLPQAEIDKLASKVRDQEFMLMSPYPGLDQPISLQAWGYQLKVGSADDDRIDEFIGALRKNATQEPQAGCSGGITDATAKPLDLPETQQGQ